MGTASLPIPSVAPSSKNRLGPRTFSGVITNATTSLSRKPSSMASTEGSPALSCSSSSQTVCPRNRAREIGTSNLAASPSPRLALSWRRLTRYKASRGRIDSRGTEVGHDAKPENPVDAGNGGGLARMRHLQPGPADQGGHPAAQAAGLRFAGLRQHPRRPRQAGSARQRADGVDGRAEGAPRSPRLSQPAQGRRHPADPLRSDQHARQRHAGPPVSWQARTQGEPGRRGQGDPEPGGPAQEAEQDGQGDAQGERPDDGADAQGHRVPPPVAGLSEGVHERGTGEEVLDRKSTRLNSS